MDEPETGNADTLTVLADDVEDAIALVRKGVVGQKRTTEGVDGEKYDGEVTNLRIDSAECVTFVDLE